MWDFLIACLVIGSFGYLVAVIAVIMRKAFVDYTNSHQLVLVLGSILCALGLSLPWVDFGLVKYFAAIQVIFMVVAYKLGLKNYGWVGVFFWVSYGLLLVVGLVWARLIFTMPQ